MMTNVRCIGPALALLVVASGSMAAAPAASAPGAAVSGNQIVTSVGDPKYPGKLSWQMWSQSGSGVIAGSSTYTADLYNVTAIMFQKGVKQAEMYAPEARGDSAADEIIATGRATVKSLTQPGTYLKADEITWRHLKNQIVATGHVYYYNSPHEVTIQAPSMTADTELKNASTLGPGEAHIPRLPLNPDKSSATGSRGGRQKRRPSR